MIAELIAASLATLAGWELFRYLWPWAIPFKAAPLIVAGIGYVFTLFDHQSVLIAFASAGAVALMNKFISEPVINKAQDAGAGHNIKRL